MDSRTSTFDDYSKKLQMVLDDPNDEEPVSVSLDYLKAITDGFSSDRLIGRGGFGEVYRGVLGSDTPIAIKKLYAEHLIDDRKYQAELGSLIRIRHQNIVLLIGYCAETKMQLMPQNGEFVLAEVRERLLCFEHISNGSLGDLIPRFQIFKNEDVQDLLGWDTRYAIMEGICRGLAFLHEECKITHMDLKPENILMDSNMVPKITDFGLSRSRPDGAERSIIFTQTLTGTLGYMPPEFLLEGKISLKTDIYSLGVIMCQIITGEKVQQSAKFVQRACRRWKEIFEKSLNDASLKEKYIKQVKQLLDIALRCVDRDRMKRPSSLKILQTVFNQNPAERSSSELNSKCEQVVELLSVHPLQLDFSLTESGKLHRSLPCMLHLTNNIDIPVAFKLSPSETLASYFLLKSGVVPPKCRYTLAVIMRPQRNPTFGVNGFFTLESTKARVVEGLRSVKDPEEMFMRAKEAGFKVYKVKLAFACAHHTELPIGPPNLKPELAQRVSWNVQDTKAGLMIMPVKADDDTFGIREKICVHPTEPWIFGGAYSVGHKYVVWDYHKLEKVHFHLAGTQNLSDADISDYDADGELRLPGLPKFTSQKRWILVGFRKYNNNAGYINVYSYMAVQNFKGSKTYLISKIKSFKAHDYGDVFLEVHPSRPYVVSSGGSDISKNMFKPMNRIKVWDWENGWDCVMTLNTEFVARQLQFNPKDHDIFVATLPDDIVKVWSIDSPECKSTFSIKHSMFEITEPFDFFTRGGKQYLIAVDDRGGGYECTIWDYHSGTLVETLKEKQLSTACYHPELPVLITGCTDGRVGLWTSSRSTFSLVGVLNCGLGHVKGVAGVKGSGRIVIIHVYGIAVAEIGHMLESERPHESERSEIERPHDRK